jgi:imidazolonepropionase-like amidohydrolase
MQAIHTATQMGACCMGLGSEVGLLKQGMLADLLVVDGNPLQDVRILQDQARIKVIMKDGDVIKNSLSINL